MVSYMLSEMVFGVFRCRGYEAVMNKMEMCDILLQILKKKSQWYHKKHSFIIFLTDERDRL